MKTLEDYLNDIKILDIQINELDYAIDKLKEDTFNKEDYTLKLLKAEKKRIEKERADLLKTPLYTKQEEVDNTLW